jgi:hypothetical protein
MRSRIKGVWIAVGLAVLWATVGVGEVRAGTIGITIKPGGIKPGTGDPPYDFVFDVLLDPGFEVKAADSPLNNFQVLGLVGVGTDSLTHQPTSIPTVVWTPDPQNQSARWTFLGNTSIPNNNPVGSNKEVSLGEFIVQTDKSFSSPPVAPGTLMHYNFTVFDLTTNTTVSGTGTFTLILLGVPEPSSLVMLAVGAAALPAITVWRRRRTARTA